MDDSLKRLPRVAFDWDMMKTAFMNLLDNAVKYSHFNRTVRISGESDEDWVAVHVEDFGLGIPESDFERIFEPYVRGTQRDPRRFIWGSGLGLAVVRDIVETHGGSVSVKSVPTAKEPSTDPTHAWENYITTFTVRLPLRQEE
jgi:signal transduction histidine kinase